ncbi:hypothetical protein KIH74_18950 [Kineosporia sp. J2-2]|uniref:Peptidase MA superfamily protein n=1 Tax=Kineosporia corallincola TaxID=2835133 RepID=A0ABS5TJ37_9ACTN|nr:hypothetical protein [Kineosporia corallincola]MBT0771025.1 hypothetical protein [Kineosporia corallincola]
MRRLPMLGVLLLLALLTMTIMDGDAPATGPASSDGGGAGPGSSSSMTGTATEPDGPAQVTALSSRCRVTGPAAQEALVDQLADLCVSAAATVDEAWGTQWAQGTARRTHLAVAAGTADLAGLLGHDDTTGLADTAAVTAGPRRAPADAVYVNGPAFESLTELGREVVLTHELVHVATRATGDFDAPTWLEEGYADYVAYRGTGLDPDQVAGEALNASLPGELPTTDDFDGSGADVAYGRSWIAVTVLARRLGSDTELMSFYRRAAASGVEQALAQAGFGDLATFVKAWREEISTLRDDAG